MGDTLQFQGNTHEGMVNGKEMKVVKKNRYVLAE